MGSPRVRALACGDAAVLLEVDDLPAVLAVHRALVADPPPGVADLVPAARTVLVRWAGPRAAADGTGTALAVARAALDAPGGDQEAPREPAVVTVPVAYDGDDLADVAALTGLSTAEVVAAHTGTAWTVAFTGFAPGFGYLVGGDPRLAVPRRPAPRQRVPAGAVGLAGEFSGVYPRASPGGWQLIGRTTARVWDAARTPPALLAPGAVVRFTAVPHP